MAARATREFSEQDDALTQELQKAACRPLQKNFRALMSGMNDLSCVDYLFSEEVIDIDLMDQVEAKVKSVGQRDAVRLLLTSLIRTAQREKSCRVAREFYRSLVEAGESVAHLAELVERSLIEAEADIARIKGSDSSATQSAPPNVPELSIEQQNQHQEKDTEEEEEVEKEEEESDGEEEEKDEGVGDTKLASISSEKSLHEVDVNEVDGDSDSSKKELLDSLNVSNSSLLEEDKDNLEQAVTSSDKQVHTVDLTQTSFEGNLHTRANEPQEDDGSGAVFKEPLDANFEEVVEEKLSDRSLTQADNFHQEETVHHEVVDPQASFQQPCLNAQVTSLMNGDLERCSPVVDQAESVAAKWRFITLGGKKYKLDEMRLPSKDEKERLIKEGAPRWKKVIRELPSGNGGSAYEYVDEQHFATSYENDRERCRGVLEDWLAKTSVNRLGGLYDAYRAAGLGRVAESLLKRCTE